MAFNYQQLKNDREQSWRIELRKKITAKDRTSFLRVEMPAQAPLKRKENFKEVNIGLSSIQAQNEARRCLDCPTPTCISGCPVNINIPGFIKQIEIGNFEKSINVLKETNSLPAICGRVCPQEIQCENKCIYKRLKKPPVAIGFLERFASDWEKNSGILSLPNISSERTKKIAVIGSGPAGLTFAGDMAKRGYLVTVFEALHELGGVLVYGIPEFRLPKEIVKREIEYLVKMGVTFEKNNIVGVSISIDDLKKDQYEGFFIGSGAGLPKFMKIEGENLKGIYSSNEYLTRVNLMKAYMFPECDTPIIRGKNVIVIGGGNTAIDSVRTALRLGAEHAIIIYRRSEDEMPARIEEINHAKEEGVEFLTLTNPTKYIGDSDGKVKAIQIQKMELGAPDESGRRRPIPLKGSEYVIDADIVVVGVGTDPNPIIPRAISELSISKWGTIVVDEKTMQTSIPEFFAGGDIVRGGATVILAMGDGKVAAESMHQYFLKEKK